MWFNRYYEQKYIPITAPTNLSCWVDADDKQADGDKIFGPKIEKKKCLAWS